VHGHLSPAGLTGSAREIQKKSSTRRPLRGQYIEDPESHMKNVIRHARRAAVLLEGDSLSDGQLLEAFVERHDEAAFEMILRRHGGMVLGVCQRILRNAHDAEDCFQAVFLVLVRKAASIRQQELLGPWLYGVSLRTAMKAKTMNARRRKREKAARPP